MNTEQAQCVDRSAFAVTDLCHADDEADYWRAKTPAERLLAVEIIRRTLYGYNPATARLQRVLEVAELTTG
jgi:hypothetical protein